MTRAKQVTAEPTQFICVVEDPYGAVGIVGPCPSKEALYEELTTSVEDDSIAGVDLSSENRLTQTVFECYEIKGKPWKLELSQSKVTITEKSE